MYIHTKLRKVFVSVPNMISVQWNADWSWNGKGVCIHAIDNYVLEHIYSIHLLYEPDKTRVFMSVYKPVFPL